MSTFSHISPVSSLSVIHKFDYVFAENGTVQYKDGKLLSKHVSEHTESNFSRFISDYIKESVFYKVCCFAKCLYKKSLSMTMNLLR